MCLLLWRPKTAKIEEKYLQEGFRCNGHGAGFAWVEDNGVVWYHKGFETWAEMQKNLHEIEGKDAVIHFRLASVGKRSTENCHPFLLGKTGWVMAHNGTLSGLDIQGDESDTSAFARDVLTPLMENSPELIFDPDTKKTLETRIGGSKMVLLGPNGQHQILNEKGMSCHWYEGAWFSNYSYKIYTPTVHRGTPHGGACYGGRGSWYGNEMNGMTEAEYQEELAKIRERRRQTDAGSMEILRQQQQRQGDSRIPARFTEYSKNGNWFREHVYGAPGEWKPTPAFIAKKIEETTSLDYEKISSTPPKEPERETIVGRQEPNYEQNWREQRKRSQELRRLQREVNKGERFIECLKSGNCDECAEPFLEEQKQYYDNEDGTCLCRECALREIRAMVYMEVLWSQQNVGEDSFQTREEVEEFLSGQTQDACVACGGTGTNSKGGLCICSHPSEKGLTDGELYEQEQLELERAENARIIGLIPFVGPIPQHPVC